MREYKSNVPVEVYQREVEKLNSIIDELQEDLKTVLTSSKDVIVCDYCKHNIKCPGKDCEYFVSGVGDADGKYPNLKWTCQDFLWGECDRLINTKCNGCFDNDYSGFEYKNL
jgi:hypothetical protein